MTVYAYIHESFPATHEKLNVGYTDKNAAVYNTYAAIILSTKIFNSQFKYSCQF